MLMFFFLGDSHPDTLISMGNPASTFSDQGRWEEAEELEVQVMDARKRVLSDSHPHTLTSMSNLAFTFKHQEKNEAAIKLLRECFELRKKILGSEHPDTRSSKKALKAWEVLSKQHY